jgi:hypothetical protein
VLYCAKTAPTIALRVKSEPQPAYA